jgi:hypothetical protein
MQTLPRAWARLAILAVLGVGTAFCQQLAFTSRTYVQSPVLITSVDASRDFGFDSVGLRNDGPKAINAVHFQITVRTSTGDEIADERRVAVSLDPRDSKRLTIGMGHIEGLRQQAKSRKQESALVIITVESVEFQDGSEWKQTERQDGITIDPVLERTPRK